MNSLMFNAIIFGVAVVLSTLIVGLWPRKKPTPPKAVPAATAPEPTPAVPQPSEASRELSALLNQRPTRTQNTVTILDTSSPRRKSIEDMMTPLTTAERITLGQEEIRIAQIERQRRAEILKRQRGQA